MKNQFIILAIISFIGLGLLVVEELPEASKHITTLAPGDFKEQLYRKHGILIDVDTHNEFEDEHIAGAINLDVAGFDFTWHLDSLFDNKVPYFVYSKHGVRGDKAMKIMSAKGFTNVYNMRGGLVRWKDMGFPVVRRVPGQKDK